MYLADEMSMNDSVVEVEDLKFLDRSYGKNWIKLLYVERNGNIHSIREYEVSSLITLDNVKEYKLGDNTNVIATDSQKNTVYLLAKKFGVGTPEQFAILVAQHYIETYPWVIRADITVEALRWSRIRENHVHAFVAEPTFTRWGKVGKTEYPLRINPIQNCHYLSGNIEKKKWNAQSNSWIERS